MPKSSKGFLRVTSFLCDDSCSSKDFHEAAVSPCEPLGVPFESLGVFLSLLESLKVPGST